MVCPTKGLICNAAIYQTPLRAIRQSPVYDACAPFFLPVFALKFQCPFLWKVPSLQRDKRALKAIIEQKQKVMNQCQITNKTV